MATKSINRTLYVKTLGLEANNIYFNPLKKRVKLDEKGQLAGKCIFLAAKLVCVTQNVVESKGIKNLSLRSSWFPFFVE